MDPHNLETFENINSVLESECMNFERKYRELLYELGRKRHLLDETRQLLNQSTSKQHELEVKLESELREKEDKIKEIKLFQNVAKQIEEFRNGNKENNVHKIELEIIRKENESYKFQIQDLQQENLKLKRELEDMHGKHNCLQAFQKDIMEQQNKIKNCLSQYVKTNKFTNEIEEKLRKFQDSYNICLTLEMYTELANKRTIDARKENEQLEYEIIRLRAELLKTQELYKVNKSLPIQNFDEDIQYWKNLAEERKHQLDYELKNLTILSVDFHNFTSIMSKSVQNEVEQHQMIKKLEETVELLQNENVKLKEKKIMIDFETQTEIFEDLNIAHCGTEEKTVSKIEATNETTEEILEK